MASRMCLMPSCSPSAEIKRTSRARIWPFIRGSSSVATAHHSSRNRVFGAVRPPRTINLLVRRTDADPNYERDYTVVPSLVSIQASQHFSDQLFVLADG